MKIKLNISFEFDPHTVVELIWLESHEKDLYVSVYPNKYLPARATHERYVSEHVLKRWATDVIRTPMQPYEGRWAEVAAWMLELGRGHNDTPTSIVIQGLKVKQAVLNIEGRRAKKAGSHVFVS
jgi:hypothetical protein